MSKEVVVGPIQTREQFLQIIKKADCDERLRNNYGIYGNKTAVFLDGRNSSYSNVSYAIENSDKYKLISPREYLNEGDNMSEPINLVNEVKASERSDEDNLLIEYEVITESGDVTPVGFEFLKAFLYKKHKDELVKLIKGIVNKKQATTATATLNSFKKGKK